MPDLSQLPIAVLQTGTVETLLGHVEDLMARLKVNLRRNAILEAQLLQTENEKADLARSRSSMEAQLQIHLEKDRMGRDRVERAEYELTTVQEQRHLLVRENESLLERNLKLALRVRALESFVRRCSRWVKPGLKLRSEQLRKLRAETGELVGRLAVREATISDLNSRQRDLLQGLQQRREQAQADQRSLVESYEQRLSRLSDELRLHQDRSNRMETAVQSEALLRNRVIELERKLEIATARRDQELERVQSEMIQWKESALALRADNELLEQQLTQARATALSVASKS